MRELKNRYHALKSQAKELMQNGNVNAYLAKLVEVNDTRMQLIQITAGQ